MEIPTATAPATTELPATQTRKESILPIYTRNANMRYYVKNKERIAERRHRQYYLKRYGNDAKPPPRKVYHMKHPAVAPPLVAELK